MECLDMYGDCNQPHLPASHVSVLRLPEGGFRRQGGGTRPTDSRSGAFGCNETGKPWGSRSHRLGSDLGAPVRARVPGVLLSFGVGLNWSQPG